MAHTRSNGSLTVVVCSCLLGACGGKSASPELPVDPVPNPNDVATDDGASGATGTGGSAGSIEAPSGGEPPLSTGETCSDGVLDGDEADVDCGGSGCGVCSTGASCRIGFDCEGLRCLNGRCQEPTCEDGVHNGEELGVDCGGSCGRCQVVFEPCDCPMSEQLQALACGGIDLWTSFLSADGDTLVYDQNGATYRWTAATGPVLQRGDASVAGLSADGQTLLLNVEASGTYELWGPGQPALALPIVSPRGLSDDARSVLSFDEGRRAATLWNDGFSLTVGASSGGSFDFPRALSADGQVVVGTRYVSDPNGGYERPFRWTRAGMETLEPLPAGATHGTAVVTSRDGSVLAGWVSSSADYLSSNIFRWTSDQGFLELATAPIVAGLALQPPLLSDDGAVLVGTLGAGPNADILRAFRWSQAEGMLLLGGETEPPSRATLVSADARTIVGYQPSNDGVYDAPFVWSATAGMHDLPTTLADAGANVTGWTFESAGALSADGRVLVGMGRCGDKPAAYRAVLPR